MQQNLVCSKDHLKISTSASQHKHRLWNWHWKWFHHRRFQAVLKLLGLPTENLFGGVYFQYSYRWYIGRLKLLKRSSIKNFFSGNFPNFRKSNFANITWKMHEAIFEKNANSREQSCCFKIKLMKWLQYRRSPGKFPTILEHIRYFLTQMKMLRKRFDWESFEDSQENVSGGVYFSKAYSVQTAYLL